MFVPNVPRDYSEWLRNTLADMRICGRDLLSGRITESDYAAIHRNAKWEWSDVNCEFIEEMTFDNFDKAWEDIGRVYAAFLSRYYLLRDARNW